jgi:hypothetical protein
MTSYKFVPQASFMREACDDLGVTCFWCLDRGESALCDCPPPHPEEAVCDACRSNMPHACFCDTEWV